MAVPHHHQARGGRLLVTLIAVAPSLSFSFAPKNTAGRMLESMAVVKNAIRERLLQDGSATMVRNDFDYERCTASQYQSGGGGSRGPNGGGKYDEIRAGLDTEYHGTYNECRRALQDLLLDDALQGVAGGRETPWCVFTAGAMGSGKSHTFKQLVDRGIVPLQGVQILDPDMFKASLPEWPGYLRRDPLRAGFHTRRESGYLLEIAQEYALRDRRHVWIDGSLRDGDWYRAEFARIRHTYPEYKIAIVHVVATRTSVLQRVESRAVITGRHVPISEIDDSIARVPRSVKQLREFLDFLAVVDNSSDRPYLVEYCDREACQVCLDDWEQLATRLEAHGDEQLFRGADASAEPDECVIASEKWEQIARNFEAARRTSTAARSDEWG